ncbi:MAG TPA: DUF2975 domain-containing protein [Chryseosolibacter sp.]
MKTLYSLFNVVFYLFVTLSALAIIYEFTRLNESKTESYTFTNIPAESIVKPDAQTFDLTATTSDVMKPQLVTSEWSLRFENTSLAIRLQRLILTTIKIVFLFIVLLLVRAFIFSVRKNETFTLQNIKRLQRIGILFLLIEPYQWIASAIRKEWILTHFNIESVSKGLGYRVGYLLGSGKFLWNWILVGLLVLVIAEVFRQGMKLKEEVDLTV